MGDPESVIANYLKSENTQHIRQDFSDRQSAPGNEFIRIKKVELIPEYINDLDIIDIRTPLTVDFEFWYNMNDQADLNVGVHLFNFNGDCIFDIISEKSHFENGLIRGHCKIPGNFLNDSAYYISIEFVKNITQRLYYFESCLSFDVQDYRENTGRYGKWIGYVRPNFPVILRKAD